MRTAELECRPAAAKCSIRYQKLARIINHHSSSNIAKIAHHARAIAHRMKMSQHMPREKFSRNRPPNIGFVVLRRCCLKWGGECCLGRRRSKLVARAEVMKSSSSSAITGVCRRIPKCHAETLVMSGGRRHRAVSAEQTKIIRLCLDTFRGNAVSAATNPQHLAA